MNVQHAINREEEIDAKNLSNKIPAMPEQRPASASGSYILRYFVLLVGKEGRCTQKIIQKNRVRIIIMA